MIEGGPRAGADAFRVTTVVIESFGGEASRRSERRWRAYEVDSGHDVMIDAPTSLAQIFVDVATGEAQCDATPLLAAQVGQADRVARSLRTR
jgi:hypothetical protein